MDRTRRDSGAVGGAAGGAIGGALAAGGPADLRWLVAAAIAGAAVGYLAHRLAATLLALSG